MNTSLWASSIFKRPEPKKLSRHPRFYDKLSCTQVPNGERQHSKFCIRAISYECQEHRCSVSPMRQWVSWSLGIERIRRSDRASNHWFGPKICQLKNQTQIIASMAFGYFYRQSDVDSRIGREVCRDLRRKQPFGQGVANYDLAI